MTVSLCIHLMFSQRMDPSQFSASSWELYHSTTALLSSHRYAYKNTTYTYRNRILDYRKHLCSTTCYLIIRVSFIPPQQNLYTPEGLGTENYRINIKWCYTQYDTAWGGELTLTAPWASTNHRLNIDLTCPSVKLGLILVIFCLTCSSRSRRRRRQ